MVYKGEKFIVYTPYFTHIVQAKARECNECHGTDLVKRIKKGERVNAMEFKDGKFIPHECVVPIVPDQLDWPFLDKEGDSWVLMKDNKQVQIQLACYGTPLTKRQIRKMAMPFKK